MNVFEKLIKEKTKPLVNSCKGQVGEAKVSNALNPLLFGRVEHRQINNLVLLDDNGKSHQIDHVEIRENGIFCIETKNYKGWIFGGEHQDKWTQTLYNEKHQFVNPIKQNKSHIYHISRVLGNRYFVHPLIVFVQNNADRVDVPYVINLKDLKTYLSRFDDGTRYTVNDMDAIYQTLCNAASHNISTKEHVENIKQTQNDIENGICPRCGGSLVERQGKYGAFWGCNRYPNCTFVLSKK